MDKIPVALSIAGSDSSAGAGIQADLKTFIAHGVYGLTIPTCIVAETSHEVRLIHPLPPTIVEEQLTLLLRSFPISVIKIGLVHNAEIGSLIYHTLYNFFEKKRRIPVIIDPVMVAATGDSLSDESVIKCLTTQLFTLSHLITPNIDEGTELLKHQAPISDIHEIQSLTKKIAHQYSVETLIKGGDLPLSSFPNFSIDIYASPNGETTIFKQKRIIAPACIHGTGCTLSAAIAANLARGFSTIQAIPLAQKFTRRVIQDSHILKEKTCPPNWNFQSLHIFKQLIRTLSFAIRSYTISIAIVITPFRKNNIFLMMENALKGILFHNNFVYF